MGEPTRGFRITSGRRHRDVSLPKRAALVVFLVITGTVVLHQLRDEPASPPQCGGSPTTANDATARPAPTSPPSPTSPTLVERSSDWVVLAAPSPSPTVWIAAPPPRRRQNPTPTPSVSQCLIVRWSAQQSLAAWGNVMVDIQAVNRCGRKLEPHEIAIWIAGYRDGGVVQTASGHAFDTIYPGRSTHFSIGLPGSIDWYERITVEVKD